MNMFTIVVGVILLVAVFAFQIAKRITLNNLIKSLKNKQYDETIAIASKPLSSKLLTSYLCDLYKARAYYNAKDETSFIKQIDEMLEANYNEDQEKTFLDLYYHVFLDRNDVAYADKFLARIKATNDASFIKYNEQAYEVMINKRTDLIEIMDAQMETDKYYGFPLGVIVYMIAIQYLALGDIENAHIYFTSSLTCFHPSDFYVAKAKAQIKKLDEEQDALDAQEALKTIETA
ncbi:MAG: hypothetical protein RR602_00330 [Longicatena sp.]